MANLVVLEVGLGLGLLLLAVNHSLLPVAGGIAVLALLVAFLRWGGRWFTQWVGLTLRYLFRSHARAATPSAVPAADPDWVDDDERITGPEDPRVDLLRLAVPDLVIAHGTDHERRPLGLAWHEGTWTAVLRVEPAPQLVTPIGKAPNLPLGALAPCLEDRGVVLDAIQVLWHCYPGSAVLPPSSDALSAYLEVLGPLPASARRTTLVAVRLDPRRCGEAVRERGGGVVGAHRALIGALSRVRSALEARGVQTSPLDPDELMAAGLSAAELTTALGADGEVGLREKWAGVTAAGIGHSSYAITNWPGKGISGSLNALTSIRALSSTVTMSISPGAQEGEVGLRGLVRVSARTPSELSSAESRLEKLGERIGLSLTPLRGLQAAGLAATLPYGGSA
ncbi:type VII secretion protein EccE [Kutzneria viridogrisea]|uniref:type VII secretion protein EccE n=1 Tax=Kutzneria TaxID=43356 RepID=UPI00046D93EC|nr:type VII secretion protein EccE [Kutzneria albida]